MRGDRVEIVIDAGNEVRTYDIVATRNGRRVESRPAAALVTVTEVTRTATRSARRASWPAGSWPWSSTRRSNRPRLPTEGTTGWTATDS